ncbi:MAG: RNA methyltransferase [Bacteroidaceae bacterium]|nr:RNA methyltransferase [Bacteroidaceae bacterium]
MLTKARIQQIRSLATSKGRRSEGLFVAEGPKLVGDLLSAFTLVYMAATDEWNGVEPDDRISQRELERASLQQHPQQVIALFKLPTYDIALEHACVDALCLGLDDVQDPGNMGTIVRVADWFGISDIFCSIHTVDIWNPKAVQATMGAISRVRVHYINNMPKAISELPSDIPVYATALDGENIWESPLSSRGLIIMGNEGNGISDLVMQACGTRLLIPSYPQGRITSESLNVAMATGIILNEFRRRTSCR